jgi:hypothetical protein
VDNVEDSEKEDEDVLVPGQCKKLTDSELANMTTIQIMKEIQKTPIRLWLASKTAKQHYFVLSENFQINPRAKDYANFVQEYEAHKD